MRKFLIFIIIAVLFLLSILIVLFLINKGYQQNLSIIENLDRKYYPLMEKEFFVRLPKDSSIEKVALTTGKDACLSMEVIIPENQANQIYTKNGFETDNNTAINKNIEKVLKYKNMNNYMKIIYYKAEAKRKKIVLIKYEPLSNEIWKMMKSAGFSRLKP